MDKTARDELGNQQLADWLEECAEEMQHRSRTSNASSLFALPDELPGDFKLTDRREASSGRLKLVPGYALRHPVVTTVVALLLLSLVVGAGKAVVSGLEALRDAERVRRQLPALHEASGLPRLSNLSLALGSSPSNHSG